MTSELRDEVSVPIVPAASRMITSRPASASSRATASPITPAPATTHSTFSIPPPTPPARLYQDAKSAPQQGLAERPAHLRIEASLHTYFHMPGTSRPALRSVMLP